MSTHSYTFMHVYFYPTLGLHPEINELKEFAVDVSIRQMIKNRMDNDVLIDIDYSHERNNTTDLKLRLSVVEGMNMCVYMFISMHIHTNI
jgi:hypothetical protein